PCAPPAAPQPLPCPGKVEPKRRRGARCRRHSIKGCTHEQHPAPPLTEGGNDVDVQTLADLLHETAEHHDPFEKAAPKHDWWDWYAAYLNARLNGSASEEESAAAGEYMAKVKHVVAK